jgi:hypothetical protein
VPAQWHVRQDQVLRAVALALALEPRRVPAVPYGRC